MKLRIPVAAIGGLLALGACGGGGGSGSGSAAAMTVQEIAHGFGLLVPHSIFVPNASGFPTQQLVTITSIDDLIDNATLTNPVLPPATWPVNAVLPNGFGGNHFVYARFNQSILVDSVLDPSPSGQASSGLKGTITVAAIDPVTGTSIPVRGRAFIGGYTYAGVATGSPPQLQLQPWVTPGLGGVPIANPAVDNDNDGIPDGLGFPGTQDNTSFQGENVLALPETFVFVADTDGDLTTHETFPAGQQIKIAIELTVQGANGATVEQRGVASTTVGPDVVPPEGRVISPIDTATNVDPLTTVRIEYTEPVQPLSVGPLPSNNPPPLSSAVNVSFGPNNQSVIVPFESQPISPFDLSTYELTMAFNFPGSGPDLFQCGTYNRVQVDINSDQTQDLVLNLNQSAVQSEFFTGEGPGLINAPVVPDAIYVARTGATPGLSVIDLNGFGASTGNPTFNPNLPVEGNSNYPNNPNVLLQGTLMRPPLSIGSCTIDGGSAGVFTLTKDSALDELLVKPPLITSVGEMMVGQTLDQVFHNGQEPTGCQSGGGNLCSISGLKIVRATVNTQGNLIPATGNNAGAALVAQIPGGSNPVSWAPHPNPPPLIFPPLCLSPYIGGQEVSSFENVLPPPAGPNLTNLLVPGDPFGNPSLNQPPSGLLARSPNTFFEGPGVAGQPISACVNYQVRQQIGHFLYMIDRARGELVVFNSNRMTVLDRIELPDPTSLAMGPNLNFLAVSNQNADSVSFIDINPGSSTFHRIIKTTIVGRGPRGIAWEPGNEDILVCSEEEGTVTIISAHDLNIRKVVSGQLTSPFEVAVSTRQSNHGFFRNVYFAWILNRDGRVALFESGPDGVNGWGFDDIIGVAPFTFNNPKAIQPDPLNLNSGCWIAHERQILADGSVSPIPGGAVSNLVIDATSQGQLPLNQTGTPQLRDMSFDVRASIGPAQLTGIPVDLAFDDQDNFGLLQNFFTPFSAGDPIELNGKSIARPSGATALPRNRARFLFVAVPNSTDGQGAVDVLDLDGGFQRFDTNAFQPGVQSIRASGVLRLGHYFKQ